MKLFALLLVAALSPVFGQIQTVIAVQSPITGMRLYPGHTFQTAEKMHRMESQFLCMAPTAVPECRYLSEVRHFGYVAFVKAEDAGIAGFEILVNYINESGAAQSSTHHVKRVGGSTVVPLWIGRSQIADISAQPFAYVGSKIYR